MENQSDKFKTCYFHVDLDAFFASVEQLENPSLKGKPVIVGGLPGDRRIVVSTCSYEARKYGVHSAMPIAEAYRLCPNGVFLRGNHSLYHEKSCQVMKIFDSYSPTVIQISIDEAFLDMSGTEKLFGKSEDAAKKLKAEILEKTGLTVSVGIASTMYIAKICSGMNKPDGLFMVPEGKEKDFMLSLPLDKVWGVGSKTQEKLNKKGFFTTKEIFNASESLLKDLFGESSGTFLYKAVRGEYTGDFGEEAQNKSLSEERTFEFDISDTEAINSILLEMSSNCIFRMLGNNCSSRTVCLKIRYEDFSTCTVQQTYGTSIKSIENLFECAKKLFEKKYEKGKGIRLLGLGLHNLAQGTEDIQGELFDFGENKRHKLEQAISEIKKKNPKIKIQKAGLLSIVFFLLINLITPARLKADENPVTTESSVTAESLSENPESKKDNLMTKTSIFDYKIGDNNLNFFAEGFWKMTLSSNLNLTFYKDGTKNISYNPILFSQEVDILVNFMLNNTWFFEATFSDGFAKNGIAAGYKAQDGNDSIVRSVRIGNSKIEFPDDYSLSNLSGGGANSPGLSAQFAGEKWQADFLLRYDEVTTKTKTFYGTSEIQDNEIQLYDWIKGRFFYLPPVLAKNIKAIYVEYSSGAYSDSEGRHYKKLTTSEYTVSGITGEIDLGKIYSNTILVSFYTSSTETHSEVTKLVSETDSFFSSNSKKEIDSILSYMGCSSNCQELFTSISENSESTEALIIQNQYFSPFYNASIYQLASSETSQVYIKSNSSDVVSNEYGVTIIENDESENVTLGITSSQYNNTARIYKYDSTDEIASRFPFADILSEFYLASDDYAKNQSQRENNLILVEKQNSTNTSYFISTDAVPGSVRVYRNNSLDSTVQFIEETGCLKFVNPPSSTEKIYVVWQESEALSDSGMITALAGFKYKITDELNFLTSISSRWNAPWQTTFATSSLSYPGFVSSTSVLDWNHDELRIKDTLTGTLGIENSTGLYRILGFSENDVTKISLTSSRFELTDNSFIPELNSKSSASFPILSTSEKQTEMTLSSVYDEEVSATVSLISWETINQEQNDSYYTWFSYNINLGSAGSLLQGADVISFYLKQDSYSTTNENSGQNYDIYLQLGTDYDSEVYEYTKLIPTWKISKKSESDEDSEQILSSFITDTSKNGSWQKVEIELSDVDKSRLCSNYDARIIVVQNISDFSKNIRASFRIYNLEIPNAGFASDSSLKTNVFTQISNHTQSKESILFNDSAANYETQLIWEKSAGKEFEDISFYRYFEQVDIKDYENLNIEFSIPSSRRCSSIKFEFGPAVSFEIPYSIISNLDSDNHIASVNLKEKTLYINGEKTSISATVDTSEQISLLKITFIEDESNPIARAQTVYGAIILDEIFLSGTSPTLTGSDELYVKYEKKGILVGSEKIPVFSDLSLSSKTTGGIGTKKNSAFFDGEVNAGISVLGVKLQTDASTSFSEESLLEGFTYNASHSIKSDETVLPFKYVQFEETFYYSQDSEQSSKTDYLAFLYPSSDAKNPYFKIDFRTTTSNDQVYTNQSYEGNLASKVSTKNFSWINDIKYQANQYKKNAFSTTDYFTQWYDSSTDQFSSGFDDAIKRNQVLYTKQSFSISEINLKPAFTYTGKNIYTNTTSAKNKGSNEYKAEIPFSFLDNDFTLGFTFKDSSTQENAESTNYGKDILNFFAFQGSSPALKTQDEIYSLNYKRKLFSAWYDLILPSAFTFSADHYTSLDSANVYSEYTQYNFSLSSASLNLFGSASRAKTFKWYKQDEFASSIDFGFLYSQVENSLAQWTLSGILKQSFFITKTDYLKFLTEFQYYEDELWNAKTKVSYTRKGKKSPLTDLVKICFKKQLASYKPNLERSNYIKYGISCDEDITQTIGAEHSLTVKIGKYTSLKFEVQSDFIIAEDKFGWNNYASLVGNLKF